MKKILATILATTLAFGAVALPMTEGGVNSLFNSTVIEANAGGNPKIEGSDLVSGDYIYRINQDNTVRIVDYTGNNTKVNIPSYIGGKKVTSIGYYAFDGCSSLTSITIPDSVTSIGPDAFYGTPLLENQTTDIKYVGNWVVDCNYDAERADIKSGTVGIADCAFDNCSSLTNITLPNSVTSIGEYAFGFCRNLKSITIPDSVTSIGDGAFNSTPWLETHQKKNPLVIINGILIDGSTAKGDVVIPNTVKVISDGAFEGRYNYDTGKYESNITSITFTNGVSSIGDCAFSRCTSLTSVTIPKGVTSIGNYAFEDCSSLTSIIIPNGVTSIGEQAFAFCSNLKSVTIPNTVTSIGTYAFNNCSNLKSVIIPNSVTSIDNGAFVYCESLATVTIPNSVTSIGYSAFYDCSSLTSITIPNSVTSIGYDAFYGCSSLTSVTIPNSVTSIGFNAFYKTPWLETQQKKNPLVIINGILIDGSTAKGNIVIPNTVKVINDYAFENSNIFNSETDEYESNITSITIPNSVTSIGGGAFAYCSSLTSITIPNSVTSIGFNAFYNTPWLETQQKKNPLVIINGILIDGSTAKGNIVIPNTVKAINDYAFENSNTFNSETGKYESNITSITIPNSVTSIGGGAFEGCSKLTSITIPNSVTSIGGGAFTDCNNLKELSLPKNVKTIGKYAFGYLGDFYDFSKLKDFKIKCYANTAGEKYAKDNGFTYEIIHEHSYTSKITKQPTCTATGIKTFTCSCGKTYTETIPATGHKYGNWTTTKNATCTATGTKTRKCSVCGATETQTIPATGHKYSTKWTVDVQATCTKAGSKSHHCVNCGAKKDVTTIPKTAHKYTTTVVKPTCTEKGYTLHKCSVCGTSYKDNYTNATGHKYGNWTTTKNATCTATGTKTRKCSVCGATETQTIPATGHKYSTKWTVDVQATCTKAGSKSHHCVNCGAKKDVTAIPKTAHNYVKVKVNPTLTKTGYTAEKCTKCGALRNKKTIAKLINISKVKVTGLSAKYYTGKQIKPSVKVYYGKTLLKNGKDYKVVYGQNKIGKGNVQIVGLGKYGGKVTKSFSICPRKSVVSVKSTSKGKMNVTVGKRSEATKYQIQYSTNNKFKSAKTLTTKSLKSVIRASSKKTYYVRVRTVRTSGGKNYYSGWSTAKKVKIR